MTQIHRRINPFMKPGLGQVIRTPTTIRLQTVIITMITEHPNKITRIMLFVTLIESLFVLQSLKTSLADGLSSFKVPFIINRFQ